MGTAQIPYTVPFSGPSSTRDFLKPQSKRNRDTIITILNNPEAETFYEHANFELYRSYRAIA